jgi:hypothetical protein
MIFLRLFLVMCIRVRTGEGSGSFAEALAAYSLFTESVGAQSDLYK